MNPLSQTLPARLKRWFGAADTAIAPDHDELEMTQASPHKQTAQVIEKFIETNTRVVEVHDILQGQLDGIAGLTQDASEGLVTSLQAIEGAVDTALGDIQQSMSASEHLSTSGAERIAAVHDKVAEMTAYMKQRELEHQMHRDRVSEVLREINRLTQLTGLVKNIATQTNLLAINAAIEAARSGEHGRGFAVVAEEVRKLSAQSQDAAEQIDAGIGTAVDMVQGQMNHILDEEKVATENRRLRSFTSELSTMAGQYDAIEKLNEQVLTSMSGGVRAVQDRVIDTFAKVQFQDITRQRLEQIGSAHSTLDEHLAWLNANAGCAEVVLQSQPPSTDMIYQDYVMDSQRSIHEGRANTPVGEASAGAAPKIDLF